MRSLQYFKTFEKWSNFFSFFFQFFIGIETTLLRDFLGVFLIKNYVFCGKPCCFQSSQLMLQTSLHDQEQVTQYQIYLHWYLAGHRALGWVLMRVVRNVFKTWILPGTPHILPRGHSDIWGRMNMDKVLNIREEQSQGGTKLAADISTAHSSMLEIPKTKKEVWWKQDCILF